MKPDPDKARALDTLLPRVTDDETLEALAAAMSSVFDRWEIPESERRRLLATEPDARPDGHPPKSDPAVLERMGHLLAIDRGLKATGLTRWWIRTPHPDLFGESPLEVMLAQGLGGMKKVRAILQPDTTGQ
jgi:hypothetical protein